jgi:hypothetical protein
VRGFNLLIELARRTTDEHRGNLGRIALAKADAEAALVAHAEAVANESRIVTDDPVAMLTLGAWSNHAARARIALTARQAELDRNESAARDALRSAFVDLKRLEMARDTAAQQDRIIAQRREDSRADELYASARAFVAV